MIGYGYAPVQASPTIADALSGGLCRRRNGHSLVDLTAVKEVRRKPDTASWRLEASLRFRHCTAAMRPAPRSSGCARKDAGIRTLVPGERTLTCAIWRGHHRRVRLPHLRAE